MHRFHPRLFLSATLALVLHVAQAQGPKEPPRVADDLCGCVSSIDPKASDRSVSAAVRICLEEAVVRHPGEVLSLLERAPQQGTRAYQLGLVLGDVLQRDCPGFSLIQTRLQLMPPTAIPTGKHGT